MKQLWSPWRMQYIGGEREVEGCIFCLLPREQKDRENLILYRGRRCFVIMNKYPYINGHLMIAPYIHTADLAQLDADTQAEMMSTLVLCVQVLNETIHPDGTNIGINLGRAAGAGIVEHVHMHIVPRWVGDTNFMAVCADTRVISEGLLETYDKLKPAFDRLGPVMMGGNAQ